MPAHVEAHSGRRAPNRPPGDAVGYNTCRRSHPGRVSWLRYAGCRGLFLNKSPCQHQLGPGSELSSKTPPLSGGSSRRNRAKRPPRVTVSGLNLPASVGLSRIPLSTPGGLACDVSHATGPQSGPLPLAPEQAAAHTTQNQAGCSGIPTVRGRNSSRWRKDCTPRGPR